MTFNIINQLCQVKTLNLNCFENIKFFEFIKNQRPFHNIIMWSIIDHYIIIILNRSNIAFLVKINLQVFKLV